MAVAQIRIGGLNAPSGVYQLRLNFNGSAKWSGDLATLGGSYYYVPWDYAVVTLGKIKSSKPTAELASQSGEVEFEFNDAPNLQWLDELLNEQFGPIFRENLEAARASGILVHAILARYEDVTLPPTEFVFAGTMTANNYSVAHRKVQKTGRRYETIKCTFTPAERLSVKLGEIEWAEADMHGQKEFIAAITSEPEYTDYWAQAESLHASITDRIIADTNGDGTLDSPTIYSPGPIWLTHITAYGTDPLSLNRDLTLTDHIADTRPFPQGNYGVRLSTVVQKVCGIANISWDGNLNSSMTFPIVRWTGVGNMGHYDEVGTTTDPILSFNLAFGFNWFIIGDTFKSPATWDGDMTALDVLRGIAIQLGCWVSLTDAFDADGLPQLRFMPITASGALMPSLDPLPDPSEDVPITDSDGVSVTRRGFDGAIIVPADALNPVAIEVPFGTHAIGYNQAPAFDVSRMTLNANLEFKSQWKCGQRSPITSGDNNTTNPDGWVVGSLLFDFPGQAVASDNLHFPDFLNRHQDPPWALIGNDGDVEPRFQAEGWRQYYVVHAAYESDTLTDAEKKDRQEHPMLAYAMLFGRAIRGERKQLSKSFRGVVAPHWSDIALAQTYLFTPVLDEITYRIVSIERDIIGDEIAVLFEEAAPPVTELSWKVQGKEGSGNGQIGGNGASGATTPGTSNSWLVLSKTLTANTDDWGIGQTSQTIVQISAAANFTLSGITNGKLGDWLIVKNISNNFISLINGAGSLAVNQIKYTGSQIALGKVHGVAGLWYNGSNWEVLWVH